MRRIISEGSLKKEWKEIQAKDSLGNGEEYDFHACLFQFVHSRNLETGRVVAYEPHRQEIVVGQLDYRFPEQGNPGPWHFISDSNLRNLYCLQIGKSTMPLLEKVWIIEEGEPEEESISRCRI